MPKLNYIKKGLGATVGGAIGGSTLAYIPHAIDECRTLFSEAGYKLFEYTPKLFSSLVYHYFIIFSGIFVSGLVLYVTFCGEGD